MDTCFGYKGKQGAGTSKGGDNMDEETNAKESQLVERKQLRAQDTCIGEVGVEVEGRGKHGDSRL